MLTDIVYMNSQKKGTLLATWVNSPWWNRSNLLLPSCSLAGTITAVNEEPEDAPELMNSSPYGDGWIVKMTLDNPDAVTGLMDAAAYKAEIGE